MTGLEFEEEGMGRLVAEFEVMIEKFPASAEAVLKKQARLISKDLEGRVNAEAEGHYYSEEDSDGEKRIRLFESFNAGKVVRHGNNYTSAVLTKANHYHLYEEGHAMFAHNKGPKAGQFLRDVDGRKTVARYMAQRAEYAELIGDELLDAVLKEAGF